MEVGRRIGMAFGLSALASFGLGVTYILGGDPQVEGVLLAVALGGLGVGLVLWAEHLMPAGPFEEEREPLASTEEDRRSFLADFQPGEAVLASRRLLLRMLGAAAAGLAFAAAFPIRSLGPAPGRTLFQTAWREGVRLVTREGTPVHGDDLEVGGVLTVFPEGHTGAADSQTLLIRVEPARLRPVPGREDWSPAGLVAYSKICTHAGCPVGLYQQQLGLLFCPCHQSTFEVLEGARPSFGPATRPLPQLPLSFDDEGYVIATGEFSDPVGPGFWELPRG